MSEAMMVLVGLVLMVLGAGVLVAAALWRAVTGGVARRRGPARCDGCGRPLLADRRSCLACTSAR